MLQGTGWVFRASCVITETRPIRMAIVTDLRAGVGVLDGLDLCRRPPGSVLSFVNEPERGRRAYGALLTLDHTSLSLIYPPLFRPLHYCIINYSINTSIYHAVTDNPRNVLYNSRMCFLSGNRHHHSNLNINLPLVPVKCISVDQNAVHQYLYSVINIDTEVQLRITPVFFHT